MLGKGINCAFLDAIDLALGTPLSTLESKVEVRQTTGDSECVSWHLEGCGYIPTTLHGIPERCIPCIQGTLHQSNNISKLTLGKSTFSQAHATVHSFSKTTDGTDKIEIMDMSNMGMTATTSAGASATTIPSETASPCKISVSTFLGRT
jgi:hypothetical protein